MKCISILQSPVVTTCTTSLTLNNSTFCPHSAFMCFVWAWEHTAIISLYSIDWLVFITETECLLRGTGWVFYVCICYLYKRQASKHCRQSQTVCHQLPAAKTHIHRSEFPSAQSMKANNRTAQPAHTTEWHYTITGHGPGQPCLIQAALFRVRGIGVVLVLGDGKYTGPQITFTAHLTSVTFKWTL